MIESADTLPDGGDYIDHLLTLISDLPQAGFLNHGHVENWLNSTLLVDPKRIEWHIARAGGIGGSEVGTILVAADGYGSQREDVSRLAKRKLLIIPPDAPNADMARGIFLEPFIRDLYESRLSRDGVTWRRRDDLKKLVESSHHPEFPWLRASLDGLYEVDGKIVIVDFKAPSEATLEKYLRYMDFNDYRAQLNHYHLVAGGHGVEIDELALVFMDYKDIAGSGVQICGVDIDRRLQDKIVKYTDLFWNDYIMHGSIPQRPQDPVVTPDMIPEDVRYSANRAVVAKAMADWYSKEYESRRGHVVHWAESLGAIEEGIITLGSLSDDGRGLLDVKAEFELDIDSAIDRLRILGMKEENIEQLRLPDVVTAKAAREEYEKLVALTRELVTSIEDSRDPGKGLMTKINRVLTADLQKEKAGFNPEAVAEALEKFGESPYNFRVGNLAATLQRRKSPEMSELRAMADSCGEEFISSVVSCKDVIHDDISEGSLENSPS